MSRGTQELPTPLKISPTGLSPSMVSLSRLIGYLSVDRLWKPYNPIRSLEPMVWAVPISLAATLGISFDFSSYRYLDVSVPCV